MTQIKTIAALLLLASAGAAQAGDWTNSANYNGFGSSNMNTPSDFSLRDPNGNLTIVDGQFVPSNYYATNTGSQYSSSMVGGVGTGGAGAAYGQASAIGNQLDVVTVGNNNTVIVDSNQVNNGNQNASVSLNGH